MLLSTARRVPGALAATAVAVRAIVPRPGLMRSMRTAVTVTLPAGPVPMLPRMLRRPPAAGLARAPRIAARVTVNQPAAPHA